MKYCCDVEAVDADSQRSDDPAANQPRKRLRIHRDEIHIKQSARRQWAVVCRLS
jgi:hypothetical protein